MPKRGLGRGLEALIPEPEEGAVGDSLEIAVGDIMPNAFQPRRRFDDERMGELVQSIREHGVVQPVLVRRRGDKYELVAGERRWRAAEAAGLASIPAVIRDLDDREVVEVALIENLQREDLNAIEEAEAFERLGREFGLTQEQIAVRVGKSRAHIANTLRLLQLHTSVQDMVRSGGLTMGHARALLPLRTGEQVRLARAVAEKGLSVRRVEGMVRRAEMGGSGKKRRRAATSLGSEAAEAEERLRDTLGTQVRISGNERRGRIEIDFFGFEDLERLLAIIGGKAGDGQPIRP